MRLKLNLGNVEFELGIMDWKKPELPDGHAWSASRVIFSLKGDHINYNVDDDALLTNIEIEGLRDLLRVFLEGMVKEEHTSEFSAPDLECRLHPAKRFFNGKPAGSIYPGGFLDVDITMDLIVHFRNGEEYANAFITTVGREEIEAMYVYLQAVTGQIGGGDERVRKYTDAGILAA